MEIDLRQKSEGDKNTQQHNKGNHYDRADATATGH